VIGRQKDARPGHGQGFYKPLSGLSGLSRYAKPGQVRQNRQMSGLSGLSATAKMRDSKWPVKPGFGI
jgi:hypothetical protein